MILKLEIRKFSLSSYLAIAKIWSDVGIRFFFYCLISFMETLEEIFHLNEFIEKSAVWPAGVAPVCLGLSSAACPPIVMMQSGEQREFRL